ncbi:MAG: ImmA/IrrE family metallo-endopeptidase [Actinobacteria bacterium]|nr:ImmA/IrrE family metallo-endopeptidase [Actinomycetota bacterium]
MRPRRVRRAREAGCPPPVAGSPCWRCAWPPRWTPRGAAPEPILCREADLSARGGGPLEREANNFAASLLMPEAQVREVAAGGMDVDTAAERFGVSDIAMDWRYFNLGITTERPRMT